jgi:ketosteroid isomerase-like protein
MSKTHVETVASAYERWSAGDFVGDVSFFDPALVYEVGSEFPDSGTYAGIERVAAFMNGWLEAWDSVSLEAVEMHDAGDRVLVGVSQVGKGRSSGISGELRYFHVWTFRDDKVVRLEAIMDRDDAILAAGLSE